MNPQLWYFICGRPAPNFYTSSDVTIFGKVIGGGLPVGAYGGRKEIMEMVAPAGPVYEVRKSMCLNASAQHYQVEVRHAAALTTKYL